MKKIAIVSTTLLFALSVGSVVAAPAPAAAAPRAGGTNSLNTGAMSLSISAVETPVVAGIQPLISGKYNISRDMAILGGFGFVSGGPSGASGTTFILKAGARKYLKTEDLAPFVGGTFLYSSASGGGTTATGLSLSADAGAEFFLAKQFSIEGHVSFGYLSTDTGGAGGKATYFGTATTGMSANFYF